MTLQVVKKNHITLLYPTNRIPIFIKHKSQIIFPIHLQRQKANNNPHSDSRMFNALLPHINHIAVYTLFSQRRRLNGLPFSRAAPLNSYSHQNQPLIPNNNVQVYHINRKSETSTSIFSLPKY